MSHSLFGAEVSSLLRSAPNAGIILTTGQGEPSQLRATRPDAPNSESESAIRRDAQIGVRAEKFAANNAPSFSTAKIS